MSVSNPEAFVQDESAKNAATEGLANVLGMSSNHVSANMQVKNRRVLRRQMQSLELGSTPNVGINYTIEFSNSLTDENYLSKTGSEIVEAINEDGFSTTLQDSIVSSMPQDSAYDMTITSISEPVVTEVEEIITSNFIFLHELHV